MAPAIALPSGGLYAITDCRYLTTEKLVSKTEQILRGGAVMLQYRHKNADIELKLTQAGMLQKLCARYGIPFIINDEPELAHMLQADGVHLGRDDVDCNKAREILGPDCFIGISCYNEIERTKTAATEGASYVTLGAFFHTQTKSNVVKAKPELINRVKQILTLPVVAIGGITPDNGKALVEAGADFLAVCSGLYVPVDTSQAVRDYLSLFNS